MKKSPTSSSFWITSILGLPLGVLMSHAADLTWENGSGTWDNTTANWDDGGSSVVWNSATPDSAIFESGSGNSVTVDAGGITAGGITFNSSYTLSGGTITLADGAVLNNQSGGLPSIHNDLFTTGTVTLSGTRMFLFNESFAGGGTLNVNTSNATLIQRAGVFDGLSTINLMQNSLDIRTGGNMAAGTTLNILSNGGLLGNASSVDVNWEGDIMIDSGVNGTVTLGSGGFMTISGDISGDGNFSIGGSASVILTGDNSYTGFTNLGGNRVLMLGDGGTGGLIVSRGRSFQFGNFHGEAKRNRHSRDGFRGDLWKWPGDASGGGNSCFSE